MFNGKEITSKELREFEVNDEIKSVLKIIANWMAAPLFLAFWIADLIYIPQLKWQFLALRLTIVPVCFTAKYFIEKEQASAKSQWIATYYAFFVALPINVMVGLIPDVSTGYYAGLNLVALGALSFIPFSLSFFALTTAAIYLPYFAIVLSKAKTSHDYLGILLNTFFIVGSIVICFLIRFFNEKLRIREINSRLALKSEIANRDNIIKNKTDEAVRLNTLSTQFSPQVVQAIREGKVDLEKGVRRAQICAIFVDIVGSTERVVRLDQAKVDLVLARFMDTVVSIFLKYDLTIDKFQGDGILAFANDPIRYGDFMQRTCLASLEVREALRQDREFYLLNWKKEMQIRIGISAGYANVGFYGNKKFFRSYTAIGAPLPFASRLTNLAQPDQILIDSDIAQALEADGYNLKSIGERVIKGFEDDQHIVFELIHGPVTRVEAMPNNAACPHCADSILFLDTNPHGIFVMKCRQCGYELNSMSASA
ncbi:adenylate/guanylate cyclase domain-containing protein [Bdellovibrio svalbardensis]|uniref:Adenylate/guanylate cyclase domain-containing protein n=1 Tax=Bdellovibrio svalbardensis TaxID=2972972 RepID=A0ABT6DFP3_9BACT|nr:adenylate/guanylate cyclase domain-containing protein [Bdellovibrio svalbardensis]MDG0815662.1 adenylate/guanylate cyclase domain-containing protein [Bdellovibrio svalbardensis]